MMADIGPSLMVPPGFCGWREMYLFHRIWSVWAFIVVGRSVWLDLMCLCAHILLQCPFKRGSFVLNRYDYVCQGCFRSVRHVPCFILGVFTYVVPR